MNEQRLFAAKALTAAAVAFTLAILLVALWQISTLLLLLFAGILLAVFLNGASRWVTRTLHLSRGWSLAAVVGCLCILAAGLGFWIAPRVAAQTDEMISRIPQAVTAAKSRLERYEWGRRLVQQSAMEKAVVPQAANLLTRMTGAFALGITAIAHALFVIAVGLFVAANPDIYVKTAIRLVPPHSREHVESVLKEIGQVLARWLVARFTAMTYVGFTTALGLWLIGVPLALTLAILTMALGFIPNLGPFLASAPAILLGFLQSPATALGVILLYLAVQMTEGYIITPLLQQRAIAMPPALLITAQVALGLLFGFLGLLLATPLTAAALVCVHRFYIEDVLADDSGQPFPPRNH